MTGIRVLPPEVARQIAAGEVVSRPLDVIRELIDNALDAAATRVEIDLRGGGRAHIRVRDNGAGIPAPELPLAAARHATSKLTDVNAIDTLGFRGEALWAAAQAGRLELVTRPAAQVGAARLSAHGDSVTVERTSAAAGTTVTVSDLFAHLPARLRTLPPAAAETQAALALVSRYALHHSHVHWRLTADGDVKLRHAPGDTRAAAANVWGPVVANRLITLAGPDVTGVISRPELTRPRRDRMHLAVNGRPVVFPPDLERAVIAAYAELLPAGHAPVCALNVTVTWADVNPNVHPAKAEVALAQPADLARTVQEAVRAALATHPLSAAAPAPRVAAPPDRQGAHFPDLTVIGAYRETYLLAEHDGDLWLIDAHAAEERVWYERLERAFSEAGPHELPEPELLQLTPAQAQRLEERAGELRGWGLTLEPFGAGLVRVRSVPQALVGLGVERLPELLLGAALGDTPDPRREVLARLACAPALKAGMLTREHGRTLLLDLAACSMPYACPHGRPTVLRLSERDVAHAFGRRGPRDVQRGRDRTERPAPLPSEFE